MKWNYEKVANALKEKCSQLGHFPKKSDIGAGLIKWVHKFGGIKHFRKVLGYQLSSINWNDESIIDALKKHIDESGKFPCLNDINPNLKAAIYRNKKNINYYRTKLGYNKSSRGKSPKINYSDWSEFSRNILPLIVNNIFPPAAVLNSKFPGAIEAIKKYHGGFENVLNKLNCKLNSYLFSDAGHKMDSQFELIISNYLHSRGIKHEVHGRIHPEYNYKYDFKINDFYIEIWGYSENDHSSYITRDYNNRKKIKKELYKSLNLKLVSLESDLFSHKNINNLKKYMDKLILKLEIKTDKNLKNNFSLIETIKKFYYTSEQEIIDNIQMYIDTIGYFPTHKELKWRLSEAILSNGGINKFRKLMGHKILQVDKNYYTDEVIIDEIKSILELTGKFPTMYYLHHTVSNNRLFNAIAKHGGINRFKKLMNSN